MERGQYPLPRGEQLGKPERPMNAADVALGHSPPMEFCVHVCFWPCSGHESIRKHGAVGQGETLDFRVGPSSALKEDQ